MILNHFWKKKCDFDPKESRVCPCYKDPFTDSRLFCCLSVSLVCWSVKCPRQRLRPRKGHCVLLSLKARLKVKAWCCSHAVVSVSTESHFLPPTARVNNQGSRQLCSRRMVTMEGTLSKWTNVMQGWRYRYFVLDDNAGLFSYYTSRFDLKIFFRLTSKM